MKQLFRHVGRGNRWSAQIIAEQRNAPLDTRDVREGKPPDDTDGAIAWLNDGARLIIDSVDKVGAQTRVWTFRGPRPAGWWVRRRLHEVLVHRLDAALAVGDDVDLTPELAADAISEWIELMASDKRPTPTLERGQTMHLHATDDGLGPTGEWTISSDAHGVSWTHDHRKGDVALRAPTKDLLLAITRRRTAADLGIEVFGDVAVWDGWLQRTGF
jgi:uncharacterized protein (TIGR03083 family)